MKGIFDAEGYVTDEALSLGINNKKVIQQLQMVFLRLGIISSFSEYDNRRNPYSKNHRFTLRIGDKTSLTLFKSLIDFRCKRKSLHLDKLIKSRIFKGTKIRQIAISGRQIRDIIEKEGLLISCFPKTTNFFRNERQMSKLVFKDSILKYVKNNKVVYNKLRPFLDYKLIPIKISKIIKKTGIFDLVDIEVKNQNFIANGVLVHNSSTRFARLREEAAHEFYKRISEISNKTFLEMKNLNGLIIGGPGPTKEIFLDGAYLNNELKKKVLGTKDLSYTGEFGLNELVDKSKDLLEKEAITKEKKLLNDFFNTLGKESERVALGKEKVEKAIEYGAVDTLFLSEDLEDSFIEEMEKKVEAFGGKIEIISNESNEGKRII